MYKKFNLFYHFNQPITSSSEVNGRVGRVGNFSLFVLLVSCDCYCFVALPQWVAMQCVIVVFLDYTHLLFKLLCVHIRWCLFMEAVIRNCSVRL